MFKNWKLILKIIITFFCATTLLIGTINPDLLPTIFPSITNPSPHQLTFADFKFFLDKIEIISLGVRNVFGFLVAVAFIFKFISLLRERNKKKPSQAKLD